MLKAEKPKQTSPEALIHTKSLPRHILRGARSKEAK